MRTHQLLTAVGLSLLVHSDLLTQTDPDAIMIDETSFNISEDVRLHNKYDPWIEIIDTSSCLQKSERNRILDFLTAETPVNPYELQVIENVSLESISCLIEQLLIAQDISKPVGEQPTSYISQMVRTSPSGNERQNWSTLLRTGLTLSHRLTVGLMYEKDTGEAPWSRKGPEHISGYMRYRSSGKKLKEVIIGDYRLALGQGLLFNNFYRKGLAFNRQVIPKYGSGIIAPYHSLDENRALRGVAIDTRIANGVDLIFFGSVRHLDARIDSSGQNITSLPLSGRHMTQTEIDGKDAAGTLLTGLAFEFSYRKLRISAQGIYQRFDHRLALNGQLYSRFRKQGKTLTGISLSYDWHLGPLNLYGEWTLSNKGYPVGIQGVLWSPDKDHRFCGVFRLFPQDFHQLNAQPISYGNGQNETGCFIGYSGDIGKYWHLDVNADVRINKWWSYLNVPFRRSDQFGLTFRKKKRKHYDTYLSIGLLTRHISTGKDKESKWQYRWHFNHIIDRGIEWRMRFQISRHNDRTTSWGWLVYQELKYKAIGSAWSATVRFTRFHILGYQARIYTYEVRPGNLFAMPAYSGSGASGLVNLKYKAGKWQFGSYYAYRIGDGSTSNVALFLKVSFK